MHHGPTTGGLEVLIGKSAERMRLLRDRAALAPEAHAAAAAALVDAVVPLLTAADLRGRPVAAYA